MSTQPKRKDRECVIVVPPYNPVDPDDVIKKLRGILSNLNYDTKKCAACNLVSKSQSVEWVHCENDKCPENNVLCYECVSEQLENVDGEDSDVDAERAVYCCDECAATRRTVV